MHGKLIKIGASSCAYFLSIAYGLRLVSFFADDGAHGLQHKLDLAPKGIEPLAQGLAL